MEHLFDMRPDRPGYRLQRLEVFNWGTFDSKQGNVYRFEPEGRTSLLVGHNGSGKSTLVDAILTLLVDGKTRNYNVAAGANKTERTTKSYLKGAYDRTTDEQAQSRVKYLRPDGNHLTAISAVFTDEQLEKSFTLTQILYLKNDGSDERVYAIADEPHELKDDLRGLTKSDQVLERLKEVGYQTTRTYIEYYNWMVRRTQMKEKAIDMFNQTVAVKNIQSLDKFIRAHMLESQNWDEKISQLLSHFTDLRVAHTELLRAKQALELLLPIEQRGEKYRQKLEKLKGYEAQVAAAESFFPQWRLQILKPQLEHLRSQQAVAAEQTKQLKLQLEQVRESRRTIQNELDRAGGDRLKEIPRLIQTEQRLLEHKQKTFQRYYTNLRACGIDKPVSSPKRFTEVQQQLRSLQNEVSVENDQLQARYNQQQFLKSNTDQKRAVEQDELTALQKRKSNLPERFITIRNEMCNELGLNPSELPFGAELIAVKLVEREWSASIEMVLNSLALSLLVPEKYYRQVRQYVEHHRLTDANGQGQRLDYLCIGQSTESDGDRLQSNSILHKLEFRSQHPLTPWIRDEIRKRFNFTCCDDVEEFNNLPYRAMTRHCHVKFSPERHQKDDRDHRRNPRHFVLGWDNTEKKKLLVRQIGELEQISATQHEQIKLTQSEIETQQGRRQAAADVLLTTEYDEIDLQRHQQEIEQLQEEKRRLEEANDVVKVLKKRLVEIEKEERQRDEECDQSIRQENSILRDIQDAEKLIGKAEATLNTLKESGEYEVHAQSFEAIREEVGEPSALIDQFELRSNTWLKTKTKKVERLREPVANLRHKMTVAMGAYLRAFPEDSADLSADETCLDSFLGLLEQVQTEDLPRHEKRFKERLNDQVTKEVAFFNSALRGEEQEIRKRIQQLNQGLNGVDYSRGTYMRLIAQPVNDREIAQFRKLILDCLDSTLEHTEEAYEQRFFRIKKLVEQLEDKERKTWRSKVTDVRNWFNFIAEEIDRETGDLRRSYTGSSGQSGGEKAKLAFTILVAALAYQFEIDPTGMTAGRFQFVVIDEMFSKVDDQNAEYALKLFKQFGLQLLIVAPLDAKARVTESYVDRYLHVVKDEQTNHSQLYSMTAREYDEIVHQIATTSPRSVASQN